MKPKSEGAVRGRPTGEAAARGEAELAIQQISELLPVAGHRPGRPVARRSVQVLHRVLGRVSAAQRRAEEAGGQALIDFLSAQKANPLIKAKGLEPA